METKQDIRKRVLEKRNCLNKQEWEEKSDKIFEKVITHPIFLHAEEIYCYIDFRNEVATRKLIETCWNLNKAVAVPKIDGSNMEFYYISSWDDLSSGHWGILEPDQGMLAEGESVCVIMPGAVFDKKRNRIGYGKGFYDRYLGKYPWIHTIGVAYEKQLCEEFLSDEFDVPMDKVITEEREVVINEKFGNVM